MIHITFFETIPTKKISRIIPQNQLEQKSNKNSNFIEFELEKTDEEITDLLQNAMTSTLLNENN